MHKATLRTHPLQRFPKVFQSNIISMYYIISHLVQLYSPYIFLSYMHKLKDDMKSTLKVLFQSQDSTSINTTFKK